MFRSYIHEKLFTDLESRNLVQENTVELEDPGEYYDVVQKINTRGWGVLELPLELVNLEIVREFNENTKPIEDAPLEKVYLVWGRWVPFDRDVIHAYIEDHYIAILRRLDPFAIQEVKVNGNYDEIIIDIYEARKIY